MQLAPEEASKRPATDKSQFGHFLRMVDPNARWWTLQTFTDLAQKPEPDPLAKVFVVNRITRPVLDIYARGAGCYFTVNRTNDKGRKSENITDVRAVWQEDDDGYEGPYPLEPSFVVETSPGHYHRYWLVDGVWSADEQGREDFDGVMARMVASYGSDPGAKGINRVLRMPGFLHRKNPPAAHMVRIVGGCRRRYTREQILEAFPAPVKSQPQPGSNGRGRDGASESHAELVRQVLTGEHYHPALCALAFRLVGSGMQAGQVVEQLRGMMLARPQEEHQDTRWLARIAQIPELVRSAEAKKGANGHASPEWPDPVPLPQGLLPVLPFDYDMLPGKVEGRVRDIVDRMQCPPDFVATGIMTGLGSVIGRKVAVRPKERDDWTVVPNQWNAIVAPPGFLKSPAQNEALAPVRGLEAAAREEFKLAKAMHKAKVKELEDAGQNADHLREPVQRRYITMNVTAEAMGEVLKTNTNGTLNIRDELMALLRRLDEDGQAEARGFFLQGWSGDTDYVFDRIGRGPDNYVPAVCISMIGGTQPSLLSQYIAEIRRGGRGNDGLIQRLGLLVWPDIAAKWTNIDRYPGAMAREMATQVFKRLDEMTAESVGARQDKISDRAVGLPYLRFCPEAQVLFSNWHKELEESIREEWDDPLLKEHISKHRKLVPSLALICHLADWDPVGPAGPISVEAMQKALKWAAYLRSHAARIYGSGDIAVGSAANTVIARVKSGHLVREGFSSRDVWRPQWSRLRNRSVVMAALDLLTDYDWLRAAKVETNGRTATVYTVNPKVLA